MPGEGLRGTRALGGQTMKITVVGVLEIAAVVLAVALLISYLQKKQTPEPQPGQSQEPIKPA